MTQQRLKTQVLVIGAGISGSTSALTLADAGYEVTLIVPGKELDGGNSALAQGGIVYRSDPNDAKDLEKDILIAGHHHNYVKAVRHLCQHGPEAVERILMERAPIPFDRLDGKLDFTREGGHGKHRIVPALTGEVELIAGRAHVSEHPHPDRAHRRGPDHHGSPCAV